MSAECQKLVDSYVNWLRSRITVADINGVCEITTPFLDRHNDRLQIFVQRNGQGLRLTDDGYTVGDLESSGCRLDTSLRQRLLNTVLNGFGVTLNDDGELAVEASEHSFPQKKHAISRESSRMSAILNRLAISLAIRYTQQSNSADE